MGTDRLFLQDDYKDQPHSLRRCLVSPLWSGRASLSVLSGGHSRGTLEVRPSFYSRLLLGRLHRPMVVAMIPVRMMQLSLHEVVDVVAVRYGFVTATRARGYARNIGPGACIAPGLFC